MSDGITFIVPNDTVEEAKAWQKSHDKDKHADQFKYGTRYGGAIGGAYSWCFTPTSIGTVVKLECSCGETLDLTDYDSW